MGMKWAWFELGIRAYEREYDFVLHVFYCTPFFLPFLSLFQAVFIAVFWNELLVLSSKTANSVCSGTFLFLGFSPFFRMFQNLLFIIIRQQLGQKVQKKWGYFWDISANRCLGSLIVWFLLLYLKHEGHENRRRTRKAMGGMWRWKLGISGSIGVLKAQVIPIPAAILSR